MVKRSVGSKKSSKIGDLKLHAFLATFFSIIGFLVALIAWKDEEYTMFYAKQSLVIFIVAIIAKALQMLASFIPIIGQVIVFALTVIVVIAWIFSWVYALSGDRKDVPIVGEYARKLKI